MISRRKFLTLAGSNLAALSVCSTTGRAYLGSTDPDVEFLTPGSSEFRRYSTPFNKRVKTMPGLIAVCRNEIGVQKAVQLAREKGFVVAVKSGGHSFEGFSLNDEGMVIDVSLIQAQRLEGQAYVTGSGVRLFQTYGFLLPKKRLIPAGSCATVGLSGLSLGGGYGLFSRRWGLTCDSLTGLRMVDGQGRLWDSKDEPELLWSCRGGGNGNFGVVTELRFDTQPAPESLPRHRIKFKPLITPVAVELCERWFAETARLPDDAFSAFVLNGSTLSILITYFEKRSASVVSEVAGGLARGASDVAPPADELIAKAVTRYYGVNHPLHFKNFSAGYYQGFDDLRGGIGDLFEEVIASKGIIFQINTLGGAISDEARIAAAAYPHRRFKYLGELQSYWDSDAETGARMSQMAAFQRQLHAMGIKSHYRNYPSLELRDWAKAYYGTENYQRLQRSKQTYDPDGVIAHPQSVRPPT